MFIDSKSMMLGLAKQCKPRVPPRVKSKTAGASVKSQEELKRTQMTLHLISPFGSLGDNTPQGCPKVPKGSQKGPKGSKKGPKISDLGHFILRCPRSLILGPFLVPFGPFWDSFGTPLGSLGPPFVVYAYCIRIPTCKNHTHIHTHIRTEGEARLGAGVGRWK